MGMKAYSYTCRSPDIAAVKVQVDVRRGNYVNARRTPGGSGTAQALALLTYGPRKLQSIGT